MTSSELNSEFIMDKVYDSKLVELNIYEYLINKVRSAALGKRYKL